MPKAKKVSKATEEEVKAIVQDPFDEDPYNGDPFDEDLFDEDPFDEDTGDWGEDEGWSTASAVIWKPEAGHELWGTYDGNESFTEGTLETDALKHFVVEKGSEVRHSFVGGQVFDRTIKEAGITPGDLVKVKYLGQTDCKAGKVNLFDIKFKRMSA